MHIFDHYFRKLMFAGLVPVYEKVSLCVGLHT
jgi:hypothetical protein